MTPAEQMHAELLANTRAKPLLARGKVVARDRRETRPLASQETVASQAASLASQANSLDTASLDNGAATLGMGFLGVVGKTVER